MTNVVKQRPIGCQGLEASSLGYGAMGLTAFYGAPTEDENSVGNILLCCWSFRYMSRFK